MLNFKKWLVEYDADTDYNVSPDSVKLPVKPTVFHHIATDVTTDIGDIFRKRMGTDMPAGTFSAHKSPVEAFNDGQYLNVTIEEPATNEPLQAILTRAKKRATSDPRIQKALADSRASEYTGHGKTRITDVERNGQHFKVFTFRFKMNTAHGYNQKMSDRINQGPEEE